MLPLKTAAIYNIAETRVSSRSNRAVLLRIALFFFILFNDALLLTSSYFGMTIHCPSTIKTVVEDHTVKNANPANGQALTGVLTPSLKIFEGRNFSCPFRNDRTAHKMSILEDHSTRNRSFS